MCVDSPQQLLQCYFAQRLREKRVADRHKTCIVFQVTILNLITAYPPTKIN